MQLPSEVELFEAERRRLSWHRPRRRRPSPEAIFLILLCGVALGLLLLVTPRGCITGAASKCDRIAALAGCDSTHRCGGH